MTETGLYLILIGLVAGAFSGLIGIGGGVILVPALVMLLAYDQKTAQGTTLFMLMFPVVALSVYNYWSNGNVKWQTSIWLGIGFFVGGYLGSKLAIYMPEQMKITETFIIDKPLRKVFALVMLFLAFKWIFGK